MYDNIVVLLQLGIESLTLLEIFLEVLLFLLGICKAMGYGNESSLHHARTKTVTSSDPDTFQQGVKVTLDLFGDLVLLSDLPILLSELLFGILLGLFQLGL